MKNKKDIVILNLDSSYCSKGPHEFKIILDKKVFKDSQGVSVEFLSPANKVLELEVNRWGRKVNCLLTIDDTWEDGVYTLKISYKKGKEKISNCTPCWIVK